MLGAPILDGIKLVAKHHDRPQDMNSQKYSNSRMKSSPVIGPTGFSSRKVKLKLFGLVCGVMIVLVLMFEAKKPENWNWMGFTDYEPTVDTRYLSNLYPQQITSPPSSELMISAPQDTPNSTTKKKEPPTPDEMEPNRETESDLEIAEKGFWDKIYGGLNYRQRMLLLEGLYSLRNHRQLAEQKLTEWQRMMDEFEVANNVYQGDIVRYLASLPESDPQRQKLNAVLFSMQARWSRFRKLLAKIGAPESNTSNTKSGDFREESENPEPVLKQTLAELQRVVDRTAIGFVEDNSLQSFAADQPAMFRLIDILQSTDINSGLAAIPIRSKNLPPEEVLFTQLYKETQRLRGQPVFFKGDIRGAYVAKPEENYLGVDQLFVFWILIHGAQNPVAVYALRPPPDFVISWSDSAEESSDSAEKKDGNQQNDLREPVEVTGILFQKMVYAAGDGQRIAPVIFAETVNWKPITPEVSQNRELPGLSMLVGGFLGFGAMLAASTWFLISFNNRKHEKRLSDIKSKFHDPKGE